MDLSQTEGTLSTSLSKEHQTINNVNPQATTTNFAFPLGSGPDSITSINHTKDKLEEENGSEEGKTSTPRAIWTWIKTNRIESYVLVTLFTSLIFSLTTFAAKDSGYWEGSYTQELEDTKVSQALKLTFGYIYYTYDYTTSIGDGKQCTGQINYTHENGLKGSGILDEILWGMQAMHISAAFLALVIFIFKFCCGEFSVLSKVVLQRITVGWSIVCVTGLFIFFVWMPFNIRDTISTNFVCIEDNTIFSGWASNLTIIEIGMWISNIAIFLSYPFWGQEDNLDMSFPALSTQLAPQDLSYDLGTKGVLDTSHSKVSPMRLISADSRISVSSHQPRSTPVPT